MKGLSIVLPLFCNKPALSSFHMLQNAIDSIESNCVKIKYEILIVDDGSHSFISRIIENHYSNNKNIKFIKLGINTGLVNALNVGINNARYDLIARLDYDDVWLEGKIEEQINYLNDNPTITIIGTGMNVVNQYGTITSRHGGRGDELACYRYTREMGCPFPHSSILGYREIFKLLGGYSNNPVFMHCEDFELWSRWLRFFYSHSLHSIYLNYLANESGISATNSKSQNNGTKLIALLNSKYYVDDDIFLAYKEHILNKNSLKNVINYQKEQYKNWSTKISISTNTQDYYYFAKIYSDRTVVRKN